MLWLHVPTWTSVLPIGGDIESHIQQRNITHFSYHASCLFYFVDLNQLLFLVLFISMFTLFCHHCASLGSVVICI